MWTVILKSYPCLVWAGWDRHWQVQSFEKQLYLIWVFSVLILLMLCASIWSLNGSDSLAKPESVSGE